MPHHEKTYHHVMRDIRSSFDLPFASMEKLLKLQLIKRTAVEYGCFGSRPPYTIEQTLVPMGELNNDELVLDEDCSAQSTTHASLIEPRNTSPEQSYSGNEDDLVEGENGKESFGKRTRNKNNQNYDLLKQQISDLTLQMTYLSHQVSLLLNALHVPSCQCGICKPFYQTHFEMFKMLKNGATSQPPLAEVVDDKPGDVTRNGFIEKRQITPEVPTSSSVGAVPTSSVQTVPSVPSMNDCEALLSQIFTNTGLPLNGAQVAAAAAVSGLPTAFSLAAAAAGTSFTKPFAPTPTTHPYQNPNSGGRRSKYCSAEEKKAVAEYAEAHGPSAAARKFGIPTPVAAYYHRKEYKPKPPMALIASQILPAISATSPSATSGDDMDSTNDDCQNGTISSSIKVAGSNGTSKSSEQHSKSNPAHTTGSPGFLRGRGRGRPKLIGDELDAELVDYMVQVKQSDPRGHLTASQALAIARDYIMEKAPGLLEEHGGQIKLKLTWAMKLVTRISERQKEIELGLPAGTISNMTRTMSNSSLPGGNFMADMVAQNLLSQQMTQIMNQAISGSPSSTTATSAASATPQILNIRALELPKPDDGDLKGEIMDASENDTKNEEMDIMEQQLDNDIENHASEVGNQTARNKSLQQHFIPTNAF